MPKGIYERKSEENRFWEKVNIKSESECWLWNSSKDKDGYGWFSFTSTNETQKYKTIQAHRYSALLKYKNLGNNLVRHTCDNRSCVNPNHLILGSAADNSKDMTERKRQAVGEKNGNSKLTNIQALEILKTYKEQKEAGKLYGCLERLAKEYDVSKQIISRLTAKKTFNKIEVG